MYKFYHIIFYIIFSYFRAYLLVATFYVFVNANDYSRTHNCT